MDENRTLAEFVYNHFVYSIESLRSQEQWALINGGNRIHYAGAYGSTGFMKTGVIMTDKGENMSGDNNPPRSLYIFSNHH